MANSTISMITSVSMIVLFTVAVLGFAIGFANDNNADVNIADDDSMSSLKDDSKTGLKTFKEDSQKSYASLVNTTIEPGSDVIQSPGSFTFYWSNIFKTFKNIVSVIYQKVFGGDPGLAIFMTSLLSILAIMFTLYIIKTWRGNP